MAHRSRWPTVCAFLYPLPCRLQLRNYSHGAHDVRHTPGVRKVPQKSMLVQQQKDLVESPLFRAQTDWGMIPETLIMPDFAEQPSIFRSPRLRYQLEWYRLKIRAKDLIARYIMYKFTTQKPYPKLARSTIVPTAKALHRQMYTALAEGDDATLTLICTNGLLASFRARIASRTSRERFRWILHDYTRSPCIVSNRATKLPIKAAAVRQAVVRIQSTQSLAKIISGVSGQEDVMVSGTGEMKEVIEYLVIQRRVMNGKEEPWMVWGTTQKSSVEELLDAHKLGPLRG